MKSHSADPKKPPELRELRALRLEIDVLKRYISEQEKLIADAIEEGNTTLRAIKYELDGLEEIKRRLNYDIAVLNSRLEVMS